MSRSPKDVSPTDSLDDTIAEFRHDLLTIGIAMMPSRKRRDFEKTCETLRAWGPDHVMTIIPALRPEEVSEPDDGYPAPSRMKEVLGSDLTTHYTDEKSVLSLDDVRELIDGLANRRVLILSEQNMSGAGTVAGTFLRRAGVSAEESVRIVNGACPGSLSTRAQAEHLENVPPQRMRRMLLSREMLPPGVLVAKEIAGWEAGGLSRAQSLEAHARKEGWKNWSTMLAVLSGPGHPFPQDNPMKARLHRDLALGSDDPDVIVQRVLDIAGIHANGDKWNQRAETWTRACVHGILDLHARHGTKISFETVLACLHMTRSVGLISMVRAYEIGGLRGPGKGAVMSLARHLPGFSVEKALLGESQNGHTTEMSAYLSMQITRPLERMRDSSVHED